MDNPMSGKRKTVLFIMPRLPFPASSGRKNSLYHYCRILSEKLGYRLVVAAFLENGDNASNAPHFIDRLVILPKASARIKFTNILKDSVWLKKRPMQVSLFWNPCAKKIVDQIFVEEKPQIVIADMIRCTEYIRNLSSFRIADLDDRISLRYQRQMETGIQEINPYGAFLYNMPRLIQWIMLLKPIKKSIMRNEINLLKSYEREMGRVCDKTVFVAKAEADQFNQEIGMEKAVAVPIGVDTNYFSYRKTGEKDNIIGFLGAMNVAHNEDAVREFIKNIFPYILKKVPNAKFLVIGGGASQKLGSLKNKNIEFTDKVKDVRDYLEKCKVFVCPMNFGSGIKTKNLEAMSMGLAVVTTTIGAENIDAIDEKEWIIKDKPEEFAEAVAFLLLNGEKRLAIGIRASNFVQKNMTWKNAEIAWANILKDI